MAYANVGSMNDIAADRVGDDFPIFITASIPTPSISFGTTVTPAAVTAVAEVSDPTISVTEGSATVFPAAVSATADISAVSVSTGSTITATTVAATTTVPPPALFTDPDATVTASTVAVSAGIPSPTISVSANSTFVNASPISAVAAIPLPTIGESALISATSVTATAGIPTPGFLISTEVPVVAVTATASVPLPLTPNTLVVITAKEIGEFVRIYDDSIPRLALNFGATRSIFIGFSALEGWERVSSRFKFNGDPLGMEHAMASVASAWATEKESSATTLGDAIDAALNAAGYRAPNGLELV